MSLRELYNRDGYVVLKGFFSELSLWGSINDEASLAAMLAGNKDKYISYLSTMAKDVELQRLMLMVDLHLLLGIDNPVIIDQPVLHVMSPALHIPGGYYGVGPHQDWASVQGSLDLITVWVALTDAGVGNFPLEVVPGSHLAGLRHGRITGSSMEVDCDDTGFVPVKCKAGDVVLLSGFLVHRTGAGTGFRIAVSQRYDNATEPTFAERGYPCAQKRMVERAIKWSPTVDQVRKIYA